MTQTRLLSRPILEMHRQVGDQHRGTHVHGLGAGRKGGAEEPAFDFDDVVARLFEGNADYLEFGAAAGRSRSRGRRRQGGPEEGSSRGRNRGRCIHLFLAAAHAHQPRLAFRNWRVAGHGGEHLGVVVQALFGEAVAGAGFARQRRLRTGGAASTLRRGDGRDAAFLQFDNAEIARKLARAAGCRS